MLRNKGLLLAMVVIGLMAVYIVVFTLPEESIPRKTDIRLNMDSGETRPSLRPRICSAPDGHVYVVWNDMRNGKPDIYLNYSTDNGKTWQANDRRLNSGFPGASISEKHKIACNNKGQIYIVWQDYRNSSSGNEVSDIYFNSSDDFGETWQLNDIRLNTNSPGITYSEDPHISSDNMGNVYVVWEDTRNGNSDIYINYSGDYGKTWQGNDIRLDMGNFGERFSELPQVSNDGNGHIYVVWDDFIKSDADIYLNYSTDFGKTWLSSALQLNMYNDRNNLATHPNISSDSSGHVYVIWEDDRNGNTDIYFQYSDDFGVTWQTDDTRLDRDDPGSATSAYQQIKTDDKGNIYVAWNDYRYINNSNRKKIYFNYSNDYGATWQLLDKQIDSRPAGKKGLKAYDFEMDINSNGYICIVWEYFGQDIDNDSGDIYINYSSDYGSMFKLSSIRVDRSDKDIDTQWPVIAIDEKNYIYVAWQGKRSGKCCEIYFNSYGDAGTSSSGRDR